jgi:hypothetical protein
MMAASARGRSRRRHTYSSRHKDPGSTATWLGTLGTLVAIATGLFTLRGEIFAPTGRPAAQRLSAFAVAVAGVCRGLNNADAALRRSDRVLARKVKSAGSALERRDLLFDAVSASLSGSSAQFERLQAEADGARLNPAATAELEAGLRAWGQHRPDQVPPQHA